MKPLYLDAQDCRVQLDGPALRVRAEHVADRWFPLTRVSQVITSCRVDWTVPALLACAEKGITVSFVGEEGSIVGRLLGRGSERNHLAQKLSDFLLRPDCLELSLQWQSAMERMAMRSLIRRAGLPPDFDCTPKMLRQLFQRAAISMAAREAYETIGREIWGMLVPLVSQRLQDLAVYEDAEFVESIDLVSMLTRILFWDFHLARSAWLEQRLTDNCTEPPNRAEIVDFFEKRRARSERLLQGLLSRLYRWLLEVG